MISGLLLMTALSAVTPAAPVPGAPSAEVERRAALMGTVVDLVVEGRSRPAVLAASERALAALRATEARLSTWRRDSELAHLNAAPKGQRVPVSPELVNELRDARRCWRETDGAFDPSVGSLAAAWGIREGGRHPSGVERSRALAVTGMALLDLEAGDRAVRRAAGLRLDAGGFGKGAGLRQALAVLSEDSAVSRASIDLGGQVAVLGSGTEWRLVVADPRHRERPVVALAIDGGSVATSGTSERGRHILDPRSGEPADDFGSLTVWAQDPFLADCLSTGLYVLGPTAALAWAAVRPDVEVLVLEPVAGGIEARATPGLAARVAPLVPDVRLVNDPSEGAPPLQGR